MLYLQSTAIDEKLLLSELPEEHPGWWSLGYSRLLSVSQGPLWVSQKADPRLELAGMIRLPEKPKDPEDARRKLWPTLQRVQDLKIGVGNPAPRLVLVGDKHPGGNRRPFLSRSGGLLMQALRRLGWDELQVFLTNAKDTEGKSQREGLKELESIFKNAEPTWIALGAGAEGCLRRIKVPHVSAWSPFYALKFRSAAGPDGYADHLKSRGVPEGPFDGLPEPNVGELPDLPTDLLPKVSGKPIKTSEGATPASLPPDKADRAYVAYVTGRDRLTGQPIKTLSDAAKLIGVAPNRVYEMARLAEPPWEVDRDQHREQRRRQILDEVREHEARVLADLEVRQLRIVSQAMSAYAEVQANEKYKVSATDIAKLTQALQVVIGMRTSAPGTEEDSLIGASLEELHEMLGSLIARRMGKAE